MIGHKSKIKQLVSLFLAGITLICAAPTWSQSNLYSNSTPLSARLDLWPYPFPTKTFEVIQEFQKAEMVYMDIPAKGKLRGVVVLFHGKNFGSDYWEPTIAGLTQAGYRVIAPDQIGFGKSSKPEINYHFDDLAQNTQKLLSSLGIEKAHVIANSMGGMLAVRFAKLYPQTVQKLVLENPLGLEDYSKTIPPQTNENLLKLEMAQTEDSYRRFVKSYFPVWQNQFERFVEVYARVQKSPDYPSYAKASVATYQMIAEKPIVEDLPKLTMPTLLVIGQKDRTVFGRRFAPPEAVKPLGNFPQLGKTSQRIIPKSQLVEFDEAGHIPHQEIPERFNQAVVEFLKK